jgi:hypothetical protein
MTRYYAILIWLPDGMPVQVSFVPQGEGAGEPPPDTSSQRAPLGQQMSEVSSKGFSRLSALIVASVILPGCSSQYPDILQTTMNQGLPPYHSDSSVNLNTAAGIKSLQDTTHDNDIDFSLPY